MGFKTLGIRYSLRMGFKTLVSFARYLAGRLERPADGGSAPLRCCRAGGMPAADWK